ncbi:uncharacterized protein LOC112904284 [Agrilus planipennis]|uniref:Uncharacterized protein LOC112904284 n=1 Tax=Agrilus planipennis TaxID=224129 RepID=A0A7F5R2Q8_AGRPL|nr:uncharacterized protein LOC112904284 [Agrilus planipennis]
MLKYSDEKLAILIGVPIVTFILIWTIAIFHKNRRKWGPYDIVIVSIIVQSILRNVASVVYTSWLVVRQANMSMEVCSGTVWIFNSVHTFQASSLTTLAVIALFSTKLETKQLSIRQYLMRTHIVYHMFCLTTLCACVGVAAILAQEIPPSSHNATNTGFDFLKDAYQNVYTQCLFMPFQLDVKYSVFILTLHVFLTVVSGSCLIWILIIVVRVRRKNFSYLKKSASDLSDLSLASMVNVNENLQGGKGTYDTYTIHKGCNIDGYGNCCENHSNGQVSNSNIGWSSDPSATVSSSNSRRPCLNEHGQRLKEEDPDGTGLQTMYPVLTVCYLFNHIPVICEGILLEALVEKEIVMAARPVAATQVVQPGVSFADKVRGGKQTSGKPTTAKAPKPSRPVQKGTIKTAKPGNKAASKQKGVAVIVRSHDKKLSADEVKAKVLAVGGALGRVRVCALRRVKEGVVIETKTPEEAEELLKSEELQKQGLTAATPQKIGPKILIKDVPSALTDEEILRDLQAKNLEGVVSPEEFASRVTIRGRRKAPAVRKGESGACTTKECWVTLEVTPQVKESVLRERRVYLGMQSCRVEDTDDHPAEAQSPRFASAVERRDTSERPATGQLAV